MSSKTFYTRAEYFKLFDDMDAKRVELLRENELLKRENELLKEQNYILRDEIEGNEINH